MAEETTGLPEESPSVVPEEEPAFEETRVVDPPRAVSPGEIEASFNELVDSLIPKMRDKYRDLTEEEYIAKATDAAERYRIIEGPPMGTDPCLLYTSDAADE